MNNTDEFAPEYTDAERRRIALIGMAIGAVIIVAGKMWISPWYKWFVATAHCHDILGYSGLTVLFYGLFVGLPCVAMLGSLKFAWDGYRILSDGQAPPKNVKVFKKTRIIRGQRAKFRGMVALLIPALMLATIAWGYIEAGDIAAKIDPQKIDRAICKTGRGGL